MKKNCKKTSQERFSIENVIEKKGDKLYVKWKGYDNYLIVELIKETLHKDESILS